MQVLLATIARSSVRPGASSVGPCCKVCWLLLQGLHGKSRHALLARVTRYIGYVLRAPRGTGSRYVLGLATRGREKTVAESGGR